ncbi:uncharacterized protein LOC131640150 [Vicia villosa]|uniref:uncharacterized protein LOC131640150 n=1 Tax=Vicia villosa TaxID=3911 RepID=UPI00273A928F|nr:uncharacterized protein LOC131640150 [Vicia villosa]
MVIQNPTHVAKTLKFTDALCTYYMIEEQTKLNEIEEQTKLNEGNGKGFAQLKPNPNDTMHLVRKRGLDGRPVSRTLGRHSVVDHAGLSAPVPQPPHEPVGYPGGLLDPSLLERGPKKEIKVARHGTKLEDMVPHLLPPEMKRWVDRPGLTSLKRTSLTKIDTNLVTTFVERWHIETSLFHMSFGEMTITLDDVSILLHLPIKGVFWYPSMSLRR